MKDYGPLDSTSTLLLERGKTHGVFCDHAELTQKLKALLKTGKNWGRLTASQKESLEMIVHKIGRILAGNPNHADHWADIAGYAELVATTKNPARRGDVARG